MRCWTEKIAERTWLIGEDIGNGTAVYMYLLEGDKEALLIDTGYGSFALRKTVEELTSRPVTVLLTHGHIDHIGGTAEFRRVLLHKADAECYILHSGEKVRQFFGVDSSMPYPKEDIELIDETWTLNLGDRPVRLIHTPGHTQGSVCVMDIDNRMLFTGDVCCKDNVLLNMSYSCPLETYAEGIRRLIEERDAYDITWPCHHEKPVGHAIIKQFAEAADLILRHEAAGKPINIAGTESMELKYKDIGILYMTDGQEPVL